MKHIKRSCIIIVILAYIFLFTGCQGISQLNSAQIVASPVNNKIPLQGTWEFSDYKRVSEVQENHEVIANSEKLLGRMALFSDGWAVIGDESCSDAEYQIRRVKARDYFLFHHNIDVEEISINNPMVNIVSITSDGALFFDVAMIDEDTAMVYIDGCFYYLERISKEVDKLHVDKQKDSNSQNQGVETEDELLRSGVFIGLRSTVPGSDDEDQYGDRSVYRTIWISSHNRRLQSMLEISDLFIPRRSGFWKLSVKTRKIGDFLQDHIRLSPLDSGGINLKESSQEEIELEGNIKKNILFAGDDYIAIEYSHTIGSEIKEPDSYRVLPLDDANSEKGILVSDIAGVGMKDIFYKSAQSHLISKSMRINEDLKDIGQEDNFTLARRNGHWTLRGRLNIDNAFEEFTIGLMPVGKLINYDELHVSWDTIKEKIPMALDAYTSPNKELLIVVTGNFLMVYSIEDGQISDKPIKKIGIKKGESVIMAEWAIGDYVARWEKSFNQLNPYVVN